MNLRSEQPANGLVGSAILLCRHSVALSNHTLAAPNFGLVCMPERSSLQINCQLTLLVMMVHKLLQPTANMHT